MDMSRMDILGSLERGEISVEKAILLLKKSNKEKMFTRKSGWFRIHVKDDKHNIKLYVPIFLLSIGMSISKVVISSKQLKDNEGIQVAKNVLSTIENKDLRSIIKVIKNSGRTNLVEVQDGTTIVSIRLV